MRLVFAVLLFLSLWQASIIFGAAVLLRTQGNSATDKAVERILLVEKIGSRHPQVLAWLSRFSQTRAERLLAARRLTQREPFIGNGWADLFELKLESRELDDELAVALTHAIRFSPYDPIVQEQLIRAGLDGWLMMTPSMRRSIVNLAANTLEGNAEYRQNARTKLVFDSGLLPLVCQISTHDLCSKG